MDREWALGYLRETVELCKDASQNQHPGTAYRAREELAGRLPTIVEVVRRVSPTSVQMLNASSQLGTWSGVADGIRPAIYALENEELLREKLGPDPGPQLRAEALHPVVWEAAQSFWRSHHRREAVQAAGRSVNAQLQDRLARRDVGEADAVRQAFTLDAPKPGAPRLRLMEDDGSRTFRTLHEGVSAFGAGCFMAIRNPPAHEPMEELDEQEALEQLAAFSILARWVERADLVTTDEPEGSS